VELPKGSSEKLIEAMTQIEQLEMEPDQVAKVIIDPAGVIVLGSKVRISTVALTHGSISVRITESAAVSQPNPGTQFVSPMISVPGAPIGIPGQQPVAQIAAQPQAPAGIAVSATIPLNATPQHTRYFTYTACKCFCVNHSCCDREYCWKWCSTRRRACSSNGYSSWYYTAQIATTLIAFPTTASPGQMALAINAIPPAQNAGTAPQQPSALMNTVINSSALGPQATVIPETNINVENKKVILLF
jgi:hypothetical protein